MILFYKKTAFCLILLVSATGLTGCGKQAEGDLLYANERYSYDTSQTILCDTWHPYDETYLTMLKEDYALEKLVSGCNSDFERVQTVTEWVSNLWAHDGDNIPEQSDPLFILQKVTEENQQYRCVEYGVVIAGCLNSLGIPARTVRLKTQDAETREYGAGHVATEAYLKDFKKWIFIDGQWGVIPMMGELPLNAVQLGEVIAHPEKYDEPLRYLTFQEQGISKDEYNSWIAEYLYYFDISGYTGTENGHLEKTYMLTPVEADNPKVFQQKYPLEIDEYTHSVPEFYPAVK